MRKECLCVKHPEIPHVFPQPRDWHQSCPIRKWHQSCHIPSIFLEKLTDWRISKTSSLFSVSLLCCVTQCGWTLWGRSCTFVFCVYESIMNLQHYWGSGVSVAQIMPTQIFLLQKAHLNVDPVQQPPPYDL